MACKQCEIKEKEIQRLLAVLDCAKTSMSNVRNQLTKAVGDVNRLERPEAGWPK